MIMIMIIKHKNNDTTTNNNNNNDNMFKHLHAGEESDIWKFGRSARADSYFEGCDSPRQRGGLRFPKVFTENPDSSLGSIQY